MFLTVCSTFGHFCENVDLCTLYDVLTYLGVEWAVLEISWLYFVSKVYNRHERKFTWENVIFWKSCQVAAIESIIDGQIW